MQILVVMIALLAFAQAVTAAQPPAHLNVLQMQVMLVRLTNWDALRLAGMVKPGTMVIFKK